MQRVQEYQADLFLDCKNVLGESVLWDEQEQRIYWTDIHSRSLYCVGEDGKDLAHYRLEDRMGSFGLTNLPDWLVAGFTDGIYLLNKRNLQRKKIAPYQGKVGGSPFNRLNDGKVDRQGRFLCGGVEETSLLSEANLISIDDKGNLVQLLDNICCSNGLGFSPDGKTLYHSDSKYPKLNAYDYDVRQGTLHHKRVFVDLTHEKGFPDGTAIDSAGGVWTALFKGGQVRRYLPDGTLQLMIHLPVSQVTCCAIGGKGLDRLFITTAAESFGGVAHHQEPLAGGLFTFKLPDGIVGLMEPRFMINPNWL